MEIGMVYLSLGIFGACLGSFAAASVWRIRAQQLVEEKESGEKVNSEEYKKLSKLANKSFTSDRSCCLDCGYELKWYDMMPIVSWFVLGGKCRKCRRGIGKTEIFAEVFLALFFVASYYFWPSSVSGLIDVIRFILWLIAGVALMILFIYDKKWYLLPDKASFVLFICGLANSIVLTVVSNNHMSTLGSVGGSVLILSGLYWLIHKISKGQWVGFGDVKLGLGLALLLADWKLAFVALFAANLIGCVLVIPSLISKKLTTKSHVPFGPLLIIGFVVAGLWGTQILDLFMSNLL